MSDPATASTSTDEAVLPIPDLQCTSAAVAVRFLVAARVVVLRAELRGGPAAACTVAQEHFVLSQPKLQHLHADAKKKLREGVERDGASTRLFLQHQGGLRG